MIQIRNFINGQWQEETGGKTVPLYNPSTGETIGSVPVSNMETCESAMRPCLLSFKRFILVLVLVVELLPSINIAYSNTYGLIYTFSSY